MAGCHLCSAREKYSEIIKALSLKYEDKVMILICNNLCHFLGMWMYKICCFGKLTPVMVCSAGGTSFVIWEVRTNVGRRNSDSYQIYL